MPRHTKPRKNGASSQPVQAAEKLSAISPRLAQLPCMTRYVLAVISSLALSSMLFSLTSGVTLGELGVVSKHLDAWEIGGLIGWKALEVGSAWALHFNGQYVSDFLFLTHLPTWFFLSSFYNIRPTTILVSYAITVFSTLVPFLALLRQSTSTPESSKVSNRNILGDRPTAIYTSLTATSIFAVVLYISYATWLPAKLVVYFEDIQNISVVHAGPAGLPVLLVTLLPAGWAARDLLFASSTDAADTTSGKEENKADNNDKEGEYLACAVYRKTWGTLSPKRRVLISRTAILALMVYVNTVVQLAGTVQGASIAGASLWGGLWAFAVTITGAVFDWIQAADGV